MSLLGLNSGLLGVRRVPTSLSASGIWVPNEQSLAKRATTWPISPSVLSRQLAGQSNNIGPGQIGDFYGNSLLWFHKLNASGEENYIGTIIQAAVLGPKPYQIGIANALSPQNITVYTVDDVPSSADDPNNNIFFIDYTGPVLNLDLNTYLFTAIP